MTTDAPSDSRAAGRTTLALIGGLHRPKESEPHGTTQSAYLMTQALARHGGYGGIDLYRDHAARGELVLPPRPATRVFEKALLRRSRVPYAAIYVANGEQRTSAPHVLRPRGDWAPVVCSVGTAHSNGQWANLLVALTSGAVRATDGFIFKAESTLTLFRETWTDWTQRFGVIPFPETSAVIANGVDVTVNRRSESLRTDLRRRLRFGADDVVFLAFSRLSPASKGDQQALIVRWKEVVQRVPRAHLVLAGAVVDIEFVAELRRLAPAAGVGDRVSVIDNPFTLMGNARTQLMSAADVFLHLSTGIEEASPLVVHEAMAHGLPVIATAWAGMAQTIVEGETGFLVPTRHGVLPAYLRESLFGQSEWAHAAAASRLVALDYAAFLAATQALADPAVRARLGSAARKAAEAHDIGVAARAYADFFARVSSEAQRSWAAGATKAFQPLVDLDRVLSAQATGPLDPTAPVRLGDASRAELLTAGWTAESAARVHAVLACFDGHPTRTLDQIALAVAAAEPDADAAPEDFPEARVRAGRLLIRMLNYGVLDPT
jgi:glycosyltransferase involved in cell wall biosynthesis